MSDKVFLDTNILLYLLSADLIKAGKAEDVVAGGGIISVQVLNEFTSVASRKLQMPFEEIQEILSQIRTICAVEPITVDTHDRGMQLAIQYRLSIYDAMIVAAALLAGALLCILKTCNMDRSSIISSLSGILLYSSSAKYSRHSRSQKIS